MRSIEADSHEIDVKGLLDNEEIDEEDLKRLVNESEVERLKEKLNDGDD